MYKLLFSIKLIKSHSKDIYDIIMLQNIIQRILKKIVSVFTKNI